MTGQGWACEPVEAKSEAAVGLLLEFLGKRPFSLSARFMKLLETKLGVAGNHLCYQLGRSCLRMNQTQRKAELRETRKSGERVRLLKG